ncbi:MAG: MFS transporter [Alphaproteobacteria bacterium]|nr:MFS transporter [Alphaproteobacteria bacterium]
MTDREEDRLLRWGELLGSDYRVPTIMIGLGILLNAINFFVFSALAPSVVRDIGGLELLPWATTLYVVSSIVSTAAGGLVRSRIGARRALTIAIIGFAAGSAAIGLAPTMPWLLAARVLQGLGSGLLVANSHGLIRDIYPAKSWARLFAAVSGAWGIAALSGPLIGGIFAELEDWRWGFFAMVPVSAVFLALVLRTVVDRAHEDKGGLTPVFRLALIGLAALLVGATGKGAHASEELALTAAALLALVVAVAWERRSTNPIFPRDMFRPSTPLGAGACFFFFISMGTVATGVYGPYFLQLLHGVPPLAAGYTVTIQSLSWTTAAIVLSGLAGTKARIAIAAGPIVTAIGCIGTVLFLPQGPLPLAVLSIAVLGFGIGTAWGHVAKRVFDAAGEADRDRVGSTMPTMQSLGMAFGAAAVGVVGDRVGLSGTPETEVIEAAARWTYLALLPAVALGILGALGNALRTVTDHR